MSRICLATWKAVHSHPKIAVFILQWPSWNELSNIMMSLKYCRKGIIIISFNKDEF